MDDDKENTFSFLEYSDQKFLEPQVIYWRGKVSCLFKELDRVGITPALFNSLKNEDRSDKPVENIRLFCENKPIKEIISEIFYPLKQEMEKAMCRCHYAINEVLLGEEKVDNIKSIHHLFVTLRRDLEEKIYDERRELYPFIIDNHQSSDFRFVLHLYYEQAHTCFALMQQIQSLIGHKENSLNENNIIDLYNQFEIFACMSFYFENILLIANYI
jgi:hypothetical protein